jgi:L-iditol 2-dehydrogenase
MAEYYSASRKNLNDAIPVDTLSPANAALIEPIACVAKSLNQVQYDIERDRIAIIGLGFLGLAHALVTENSVGYEVDLKRLEYANSIGVDARHSDYAEPNSASCVIVCPGSPEALDLALRVVEPNGRVCLFAPMPPGGHTLNLEQLYFRDITLTNSYSCGPSDTVQAYLWLAKGRINADQIVSEMVSLDELPAAYERMKNQETLKSMVIFGA